jgi:hypothetical protein
MDSPLFYGLLFIHLVSLIVGMGAVIVLDVVGILWLFGRTRVSFLSSVAEVTQRVIWAGWIGLVLSGSGLIAIKGTVDSLTAIKLFLVFMIGVNGVALHFIKKAVGQAVSFQALAPVYRYHIIVATTVSQVGWWGAITIGFLHSQWRHTIPWPASPWPWILSIAAVWLFVILVGQIWLAYHHRHS